MKPLISIIFPFLGAMALVARPAHAKTELVYRGGQLESAASCQRNVQDETPRFRSSLPDPQNSNAALTDLSAYAYELPKSTASSDQLKLAGRILQEDMVSAHYTYFSCQEKKYFIFNVFKKHGR